MSDPRFLERPFFRRCTGDARSVTDWEVWTCADPDFRYSYDQGVTLFVQDGGAEVTFADGSRVDLRPGDAMTIARGASAVWTILHPIRNRWRTDPG